MIDFNKPSDFLNIDHPHFGKVRPLGLFKVLKSIFSSVSLKLTHFQNYEKDRKPVSVETIALQSPNGCFLVTIGKSFVLLTMKDGSSRHPIIHKNWTIVEKYVGEGVTASFGTKTTYQDEDNLKWVFTLGDSTSENDLIAYNKDGDMCLIMTLQSPHLE